MAFILPDLVIESVIRDGIAGLVNNPEVVDLIFATLKAPYLEKKYGQAEIDKIKKLLAGKEIKVVHNLSDVSASNFCYSIQLGQDSEKMGEALLGDHSDETIESITDPEELNNLIKVEQIVPISYDTSSGIITFQANTDLSSVNKNHIYVDASGVEFVIQVVVKSATVPQIIIEKDVDPDLSDFGLIKSGLNFRKYEEKTIISEEQLIIGCHTKDAITTKYLYILLKYFLNSRKNSLIERCFIVSTFQGSDFTRAAQYQGDHMYHRFYTIKGRIDDSWRADEVDLIDNIEVQATPVSGDSE